jgi:5'-nucleotidase
MRILVDLDEVTTQWNKLFAQRTRELFPHIDFPFLKNNANWDMTHGLDATGKAAIQTLMELPGFYRDLEPVDGVVQALNEMVAEGHTVFICSTPYITNPTCASDKVDWVVKHLGKEWGARLILTTDKTVVFGDILIDDKPVITGSHTPSWEHVIFDTSYNRHIDGKRRLSDWTDWRALLTKEEVFA